MSHPSTRFASFQASASSEATAQEIEQEIEWITELINVRFQLYFPVETSFSHILELEPPQFTDSQGAYSLLLKTYGLKIDERIALALCLAARVRPQSLDIFFTKNKTFDRPFVEFGGLVKSPNGRFMPTGDTLLFVLAGANIQERLSKLSLLHQDHPLFQQQLLELVETAPQQPREAQLLRLSPDVEALLIWQQAYQARFSSNFPAHLLETPLEWKDLVLSAHTQLQIEEILSWIQHGDTLMEEWSMRKKLRPGLRTLFHGPPGTGKSMTAALLGKVSHKSVYRVDLSLVVSKYIGETEKNLAKVFDQAERRGWILFFDEADALFGKRTQVQDAHDRYANQEVSYLLQRIEQFDGIILLASNLKGNLDDAFTRRFESIIRFEMPKPAERLKIWTQGFSEKAKTHFHNDLDLSTVANSYEMSGGAIMNVIRYVSLNAISTAMPIRQADLLQGIRREFAKEGRTV